MKKSKDNYWLIAFGLTLLTALVMSYFMSCQMIEPYGDYVWNGFPKDDTTVNVIDTIPQDTIIPLPITIDTCEELLHLQDTNFILMSATFDNTVNVVGFRYLPDGSVWLSLEQLLQHYFGDYGYTYYQSDHALAMFIDGAVYTTNLQGRISVVSNISGTVLTAYKNAYYFFSALTYEQAQYEADHRLNCESFANLGQESWTQDQRDTWSRSVCKFAECKHGERIANYSFGSVTQSIIDSTSLYQWNNVYQFNGVDYHYDEFNGIAINNQ